MGSPTVESWVDGASGSFVVENYNWMPAFSNFLPGIAGSWGIPMWAYYVNRGQAMTSAGVRDKDGQILEFYSFNKAVMRIGREGFRTFLRFDSGETYEPFRKTTEDAVHQRLVVSPSEVMVSETNQHLDLRIEVAYHTLCDLPLAGLVRRVSIENLSNEPQSFEWLDGAARVLPYGLDQERIKGIPRHIEAMMGVDWYDEIPVFRLKQTPDDTEQVGEILGGHFYLPVASESSSSVIVDPERVFIEASNYDTPWRFSNEGLDGMFAAPSYPDNKTPCAFTARADTVRAGETLRHAAVLGCFHEPALLESWSSQLSSLDFLDENRQRYNETIEQIRNQAFTVSSQPVFDAYAGQDFLDNVMRGGMPTVFDTARGKSAFYRYSRQNGDLERDYHFFVLEPTYLSQGTGHYRSILQNRRSDTWFFPDIEDANLRLYLNLIQLDGYNPLEVNGLTYHVADQQQAELWLSERISGSEERAEVERRLEDGFTPGGMVMLLERLELIAEDDRDTYLREILRFCEEGEVGGLHEGFWVDHWHYNLDTLDVYAMVYPDRVRDMLLGDRDYTFFDDPDVIVPRSERAVDVGGAIRSYGAVKRDSDKEAMIGRRTRHAYTVRTEHGEGEIYRTTLLVKLLCIFVNRMATLDPELVGVEMEAGKPGWNDSMNGLPGLFGSGLSEAIELYRGMKTVAGWLGDADAGEDSVDVYEELATFLRTLAPLVSDAIDDEVSPFEYWDESNNLKETYRKSTKFGVSGNEESVSVSEIRQFLSDGVRLLEQHLMLDDTSPAVSEEGVPYTYFVNTVESSSATGESNHLGYPTVTPDAFEQRPVPLFLEGPVHWMKARPQEAEQVYHAVRNSPLYDRKLGMYKACEDMSNETPELGRAVGAYPRGWIENESIYLHMEYKYLLEILRSGLCEEFWNDARSALVPFMDPSTYGRSTLEGASFIVSSAYHDERLHGRAFQPRLSGLTCEFLHMWILAVAGDRPFFVSDSGELRLSFSPRLPAWMFTESPTTRTYIDPVHDRMSVDVPQDAFAFKFLGRCLVIYENPQRRNTFGEDAVRPTEHQLIYRSGERVTVSGAVLQGDYAEAVRSGKIARIEILLG